MGFWSNRLQDDYIWYAAPSFLDKNQVRTFATTVKVQARIEPKEEKKTRSNGSEFVSTGIIVSDVELLKDGKVWESTETPATSKNFRTIQTTQSGKQMSDPTQIMYVSWL